MQLEAPNGLDAAAATAPAEGKKRAYKKRSQPKATQDVGWSVIDKARKALHLSMEELAAALGYQTASMLYAWQRKGTAPLAVGLAVEGLQARRGGKEITLLVRCPAKSLDALETVFNALDVNYVKA